MTQLASPVRDDLGRLMVLTEIEVGAEESAHVHRAPTIFYTHRTVELGADRS